MTATMTVLVVADRDILLALGADERLASYDLGRRLSRRRDRWGGALFPALRRLERAGLVTSRPELVGRTEADIAAQAGADEDGYGSDDHRVRRVYYRITPAGREAVAAHVRKP